MMWNPGDVIAWRGIYRNSIWHAMPMIMVKDRPEESLLALLPGADGVVPEGYTQGKQNGKRRWDFVSKSWKLEKFIWHTNRLLILVEPNKHYSINLFWHHESNEFLYYYINFQLPFRRSHCGIDALDLELDLVISADFTFAWKDLDEYQKGIETGIITPDCAEKIENARQDILQRLSKRQYPFDGRWLNWRPDPSWSAPCLPKHWEQID